MIDIIYGTVVAVLMLFWIFRSFYNNYKISKSYETKYGKPLQKFQRICRATNFQEDDFDIFKWVYIYPDFIITKYEGKDLIINRGTLIGTEKNVFWWSIFKPVTFIITNESKSFKITTCSPNAIKILEHYCYIMYN